MTLASWYWVILILWALFSGYGMYRGGNDNLGYVGNLVLFVLLVLIGIEVFGGPIR